MSKKYIIIAAVVVVVLSAAGYFVLRPGTASDNASDTPATSQANTQQSDEARTFDALPTADQPFEAVMTGKAEREFTAQLRYDGAGNSSYSANYGDGQFTMYRFGTEHISCYDGAGCFRLPDTDGDGNASEVKYDYSKDEVSSFSENATYRGTAACGSATCAVWDVKSGEFTGAFYVDSSKRIKKVEGTSGKGMNWTIEYTYKSVTIERPANVMDSPLM